MDDSFLLTKKPATFSELRAVLHAAGLQRVASSEHGLTLYRDDDAILVNMTRLESAEVPPEDREKLQALGVVAVFCVSHHARDIQLVRPVYEAILRALDGYLGCDEEGFEPMFSLDGLCTHS